MIKATTLYHPLLTETLAFCLNFVSTPPNPALTQPTSFLIRDSSFDKSNFICPMSSSPNLKGTCTLLLSRILWRLTPCLTHSPFTLQTSGIPNHVVCATNSGYTKPRSYILAAGALHVPNHVPTLGQLYVTSFHKRAPWHLIWLNHATF